MVALGRYNARVLAGTGTAGTVDGAAGVCQFDLPLGCDVSLDGAYLYVAQWNGAIRKVSTVDGSTTTIVAAGTYNQLTYLRVGKTSGNIYVVSVYPNAGTTYGEPHTIYKVSPSGAALGNIGAGGGTYGFDLSADESTCYITQSGYVSGTPLCIRILGGATIDVAQAPGGGSNAGQWPSDVALGTDGYLYWSQAQFSEGIVKVKTDGTSRSVIAGAVMVGSPGITAMPVGTVVYGGDHAAGVTSLHAYDQSSGVISGPPLALPTLAATSSVGRIIYGTGAYMTPNQNITIPQFVVTRASDQIWVFHGGGPTTGYVGI